MVGHERPAAGGLLWGSLYMLPKASIQERLLQARNSCSKLAQPSCDDCLHRWKQNPLAAEESKTRV